MTHPTPEDFLTDQHAGEDEPECIDPLVSIADSLSRLVEAMAWSGTDEAAAADQNYTQLEKTYEELDQRYDDLLELVDEIEALIKPSTSKLANSVRAAIQTWREPEQTHSELEPAGSGPSPYRDPVPVTDERPVPASNAGEMGLPQPSPEDDVEQWRTYARHLGHGRTGPAFNELEAMNRSQIRTLLGIEQPMSA